MDVLVFSMLNKKIESVSSGIKSISPNDDGTAIIYTLTNDTTFTITIKNMHTHMNLDVLNLFTKDSENNLMFNGKLISTGDNIDLSNYYKKSEVNNLLNQKAEVFHNHTEYVLIENGKTLTSNDFTSEYKDKLDNLDSQLEEKANTSHAHTIDDISDIGSNYYTKLETLNKNEINALIDNIANGMTWKASVDTSENLPTEGNEISDTRVVVDTSTIMIWNGTVWISIGSSTNVPKASATNDGQMSKEDYSKLESIVVNNLVTNTSLTSTLSDYVKTTTLSGYALSSHSHDNYVIKEEGKVLSSNDFTNTLKTKLDGLSNYDDTDIKADINTKATTTYVDNSIEGVYKFKGSVNTTTDLPTNAKVGDIYKVVDIDSNMVWLGDVIKWNTTSCDVDMSEYQTVAQADNKYASKTEVDTKLAGYSKTVDIDTKLERYVKTKTLTSTLNDYNTSSEVDTKLSAYKTTESYNTDKGNSDISTIGDGTFTNAILTIYNSLNNIATNDDIDTLFV